MLRVLQFFLELLEIYENYFLLSNLRMALNLKKYIYIKFLLTEWLVYVNDIFTGLLALWIAYYGNAIHRASWIGGLVIYQSIIAIALLIPEIYRPNADVAVADNYTNLCVPSSTRMNLITEKAVDVVTLVAFFFYQLLFSFATISFICHGISYLDDSVKRTDSATYIAGALASKELGKYVGNYLAWVPHYDQAVVFRSPGELKVLTTRFYLRLRSLKLKLWVDALIFFVVTT